MTAFLGYVLPYGQMSLWGATVITNLMSAIPWIGQDIVEFIWGGFSVSNATLNRFFSLHFVLPFILAALALMHLIALHDSAGSNNPLGVSGNYDRVPFAPYFIFKDIITIFIFMWVLSLFVFFIPNVLGDSENYVMANPMQTPPAMACIEDISINFDPKNIVNFFFLNPFILQQFNDNNISKHDKNNGYINISNKKILISKSNLQNIIIQGKIEAKNQLEKWEAEDYLNFQKLVNGFFQAEGYVGGSFLNEKSHKVKPKIAMTQNASAESIKFFCLFLVINPEFKIYISRNKTFIFHLILSVSNWKSVIKAIPYFSFTYGNKHKGFARLKDIYFLSIKLSHVKSRGKIKKDLLEELLILGYNTVNLSQKKLNLEEKMKIVLNKPLNFKKSHLILNKYTDNNFALNILFILGFFLGDGNFSFRIRDEGKGLWFIPRFRFFQKNTLENNLFYKNIEKFLHNLEINSLLSETKEEKRLVVVTIEGINNCKIFYNHILNYSNFFFWKQYQLSSLRNYFILANVSARHWKAGQLALLDKIYTENAFPKIEDKLEHWKNKLEIYFTNKEKKHNDQNKLSQEKNNFYISKSKDKSWMVTLPVALKIKPRIKYFFFKTYGNPDIALKQAITYRDTNLENWLKDNGF